MSKKKDHNPGRALTYVGLAIVWLTAMVNSTDGLPREWLIGGLVIGLILCFGGIALLVVRSSKK